MALTSVEAHGSNGEDWRTVAGVLTQQARPGDAVIYYPYGVKIMVDAYLPKDSNWVTDGVGTWVVPDSVAEQHFAEWLAGHPRIWFVFYAAAGIDAPTHDAWFQANGYTRTVVTPERGGASWCTRQPRTDKPCPNGRQPCGGLWCGQTDALRSRGMGERLVPTCEHRIRRLDKC